MNLTELTSPVYLGLIYLLVFPVGYLLLDFPVFKKFHALPFSVRFPIYLAFGLISSTVIYFFIGLLIIHALIPIILFSFSFLLFLLKKIEEIQKFYNDKIKSFSIKNIQSYFPLILFLVSFVYFSYVVGYLKWPTPSDALNHGQTTAQIINDTNILGISYPSGFHVTAANLSLSLTLYPGEGIFILASAIMALIPSVLYSLTYLHTKSLSFSLLAFMSAFLINASSELQHWLVSSFFIGRYAAIYGYLAIFTFSVFISFEETSRKRVSIKSFFPAFLVSIAVFMIYPSFVVFVGLFFVYFFLVKRKIFVSYFVTLSGTMKFGALCFFSSIILGLSYMVSRFNLFERVFRFIVTPSENWGIPLNYFDDWRFGFLIFLGVVIAVFLIVKKQYVNFSILYLIICIPILLSLNDALFPYLIFLLPKRTVLMMTCLSWILFSILLNLLLFKSSTEKRKMYLMLGQKKSKKINIQYITWVLVSVLFVSQLVPTLIPHLSFMQASGQYADWFVNQKGFADDFEALEWINSNIPSQDLILNDLSYSSFYLRSLSIKNVGIIYHNIFRNDSDILDFIEIWKNPSNTVYLKRMIETYGVKYIFITSEVRFFDFIKSKNDIVEYTHKFYTPSEYIAIFNNYAFLIPIFRKGGSVIYRILS